MLTLERPTKEMTYSTPALLSHRIRLVLAFAVGFVTCGLLRKSSETSRDIPKSPGDVMKDYTMTPGDAEMVRKVLDPNSTVGKPTLKCGPALEA